MGKFKILIGGFIASVTALVLLSSPVFAVSSTIVIKGNTSAGENQPGWMFNRDMSTATPFEFNTNQHSIGSGSLYVKPIGANANDKFIGENFINAPISDVNTISYDFRIGSGGSSTQEEQFYMNVYANFGVSNDLNYYDCRYNVIPTTGSTSVFSTVTFDPTQAYAVATRGSSPFSCPPVPTDMNTLSTGSNIRAFALNVGDTSSSDIGLDGYLDKVVVDTDSYTTTYDFEPTLTPSTKNDCKHNGWKKFNTPSFSNQGKCIKYVEQHHPSVEGTLKMSNPSQKIKFDSSDRDHDNHHHKNKPSTVEYWNYDYPGVLHYKANVLCTGGDTKTGEARVLFQIPAGHLGLSGLYIVAYVKEVHRGTDLYGHAATSDLATATQWCNTGVGFSPAMYTVTRGEVEIH